ncbi:hypothetical protein C0J52_23826 [Blattella germanica]|nr:hypothetical protein C0J52_23826 [Blattella germanica]
MSRKGRETTKEERALIILLHEQNKSLSTISKMVKRPKSTVQGIISRFGKRKSTENMKRSGRPRKYVEYGIISTNGTMDIYEHYPDEDAPVTKMELHDFLTTSLEEGTFKTAGTHWISESLQSEDSSYSELHSSGSSAFQDRLKQDETLKQEKNFSTGTSSMNLWTPLRPSTINLKAPNSEVIETSPSPLYRLASSQSESLQSTSQPLILLQQNEMDEKTKISCGEISLEIKNKQSKIEEGLKVKNQNDKAYQSFEEIAKKCISLNDNDNFDDFGRYVASLLRNFPIQRAMEMQKQVINLILGSNINPETTFKTDINSTPESSLSINSKPTTLTTNVLEMLPPPAPKKLPKTQVKSSTKETYADQSLDKQSSHKLVSQDELSESTNVHSLPLSQQGSIGEEKPSTNRTGTEFTMSVNNHSDIDETKQIDTTLKRLEDIYDKLNHLSVKDDNFDSFGRYVASILRCLPTVRALELQQMAIDLILESHFGLFPMRD